VNEQVAFTTRSYCYKSKCSYPGPTISLKPGDNFTLTLVNKLRSESVNEEYVMNTMHSPNTTNVHTHGIHIDPNVDNVFVSAEPGESLVYPYHIPTDHSPGTHWYHSHYHGSSTYQVMGGLVGAIIVEPTPAQNIPLSITEADEYLLVISRLKFDQEVSSRTGEVNQGCGRDFYCDPLVEAPLCTGEETEPSPYESFRIYSYTELGVETGNQMDVNPVLINESIQDMHLVNGQFRPTLRHMVRGSPAILRIVHASGGGQLALSIREDGCVMEVIAYDGVYLDSLLPMDTVYLVEASRADIQVVCYAPGVFTVQHHGDDAAGVLFYLNVSSTGQIKPMVTNADLGNILRPWYLQDLTGSEVPVDSFYSLHTWRNGLNHSICGHWMGAGYNCSGVKPWGTGDPNTSSTVCPFSQFSGERGLNPANYTTANKLVTPQGAVNQWAIYGMGNDQHPMHIHVNHFQVIEFDGDGENSAGHEKFFLPGQWRDTIPAFEVSHLYLRM